jgi:hypothetical protein
MTIYCRLNSKNLCIKTKLINENDAINCLYNTDSKRCNKLKTLDSKKTRKVNVIHKNCDISDVQKHLDSLGISNSKKIPKNIKCKALSQMMKNPTSNYIKLDQRYVLFLTTPKKIIFDSVKISNSVAEINNITTFIKRLPNYSSVDQNFNKINTYIGNTDSIQIFSNKNIKINGTNIIFDSKYCENEELIYRIARAMKIDIYNQTSVILCKAIETILDNPTFTKQKPYVVLNDDTILFQINKKYILFNINKNINDNQQLYDIYRLLIDIPYYFETKIDFYEQINKIVKVPSNFPYLPPSSILYEIPKTPKTPLQTIQYKTSMTVFAELFKKMSHTLSANHFQSNKTLLELVPKENIMNNGKDIRMYHGTNSSNWQKIKKEGIKPIGGGMLANGFYFTPSIAKASNYFKTLNTDKKVIIEIIIKNADKLTVGLFNKFNHKNQINPIITQTMFNDIWQFIVREQKIIDQYFKIHRVFIIE